MPASSLSSTSVVLPSVKLKGQSADSGGVRRKAGQHVGIELQGVPKPSDVQPFLLTGVYSARLLGEGGGGGGDACQRGALVPKMA